MSNSILVLLSGGQDSATCLALASDNQPKKLYTISFDYGQRHRRELECSKVLSSLAEVEEHFEVKVSSLEQLGASALIEEGDITLKHKLNEDLPASFVPGRNMLFLTLAAAKAYQLGIKDIYTGVCQTDFSGYPDCRDNSIKAIQVALFLCLDFEVIIHTPLMWKTKAETVLLMKDLGRLDWYKYTHTCYEGVSPPCGRCPACLLREEGFNKAGIIDPIRKSKCKK